MSLREFPQTGIIVEHSFVFARRECNGDVDLLKVAIEFIKKGRINRDVSLSYERRELPCPVCAIEGKAHS